jgi:hypothetical protein
MVQRSSDTLAQTGQSLREVWRIAAQLKFRNAWQLRMRNQTSTMFSQEE